MTKNDKISQVLLTGAKHTTHILTSSVGNEEDLFANISLVMRFMVLSGDEFFSKTWFPLLSYFFLFMLT